MNGISRLVAIATILLFPALSNGHAIGALGAKPLAWQNAVIGRVVGGGSPFGDGNARDVDLDGKRCVSGDVLHFDVRDEYAFDTDETIQLEINFHTAAADKVALIYDRSDVAPGYNNFVDLDASETIVLSSQCGRRSCIKQLTLERARFANLGFAGTDFTLSTLAWEQDASGKWFLRQSAFTVCDVSVSRSFASIQPAAFGVVNIEVFDEEGQRTPVRIGIYDQSGRLPLPGDEAARLRTFNGVSRIVALRPGAVPWPVKNHSAFYINASYHATLPVGDYEVIVGKGPEYRIARRKFAVTSSEPVEVRIQLQRWVHMIARGWYSGDGHIHYTRNSSNDDRDLLLVVDAEGLNVANILQIGNSGTAHFPHYRWGEVFNTVRSTVVLVPGQEDPRTSRRGHTIQWNIKEAIRNPARYLLYHEVFAKARSHGGVTGYAHAVGDEGAFGNRAGLALDVPFELVDFVEVLQAGTAGGDLWFDFLNLGFKLSPSAGTDYPYIDVPGAVRSYVHLDNEFSSRAWFDGLKGGQTFVTNGPMIEFSINEHIMGAALDVAAGQTLSIKATATLNPDIDHLDRIELIEHGDVIKTVSSTSGTTELSFKHSMSARKGSWFVLRALGKQQKPGQNIVAMSAPIYVHVDGRSFWKPAAIPEIVERLKKDMQLALSAGPELAEGWDTHEPDARNWETQKPLLEQRIDAVNELYDALLKRAQRSVASGAFE